VNESGWRAGLLARASVRILFVVVGLGVIAVALVALGVIRTGSAQAERPGTPLSGASWNVAKISSTEVSTGHRTGGPPFAWGTGFSVNSRGSGVEPGVFCAFVTSDGPLWKVPGGHALTGGTGGPDRESGGTKCGSIDSKTGLIRTLLTRGGSVKQPFLKTTETWPTFDLGVAAYPLSVHSVRLHFAGGGSSVLPLRRMPAAVRPKSWEPFRYVSFGVDGCVDTVEGISKGVTVARVQEPECNG
jgi:hypothetical protein